MPRDPFADVYTEQVQENETPGFRSLPDRLAVERPDFLGEIPTADWRPRKRRDHRSRGSVMFVRQISDLKLPLEKIAQELDIPRDMVVRYLLERGIERHYSGEEPLEPRLQQRLTLYPGETPPGKMSKKSRQKGIGFRKIPAGVRDALNAIANRLHVPLWQVVRKFLESGIEGHKSGAFAIRPVAVQIEEYTLYPDE